MTTDLERLRQDIAEAKAFVRSGSWPDTLDGVNLVIEHAEALLVAVDALITESTRVLARITRLEAQRDTLLTEVVKGRVEKPE